MLARTIIDQAKTLLNDTAGRRWGDQELLGYLNDGQRQVVTLMPSAKSSTITMQLAPGIKQSIPATAMTFVEAECNMGSAGSVAGLPIIEIDRGKLDNMHPDWRTDSADGKVMFSCHSKDTPREFEVYPAQPDPAHHIDLVVTEYPTDCTLATYEGASTGNQDTAIDMPVQFADALLYFVLFKAHSKDFRYAVQGLAERWWNKMLTELGLTNQRETVEARKLQEKVNEN